VLRFLELCDIAYAGTFKALKRRNLNFSLIPEILEVIRNISDL
jgi:hypothetical protein